MTRITQCLPERGAMREEPALQALLVLEQLLGRQVLNGALLNGAGISVTIKQASQGLANPHPQSIVNGTIGDLEVARPTVIRPLLIVPNPLPKSDQNQPQNPFSWSANPAAKPPVKIGPALLAGHGTVGRRAAVRPKPAIGAAPALGA